MNFDTKYLIRWGIPGWITLAYYLYFFIVRERIDLNAITSNNLGVLSSLLAALPIGVIVGYVIYQCYFTLLWVANLKFNTPKSLKVLIDLEYSIPEKNKEKYFLVEYVWHNSLSKVGESRMNYIAERYRHLLTKKHEVGSFLISLCLCTIPSVVIIFFVIIGEMNFLYLISTVINFALLYYTFFIFNYYSDNVDYFMSENLKDLLEKKE
ncbi:hypothetical protein [Terribacillus saccharophilus]|uniref:hypothetical protein n=1 Tax=Terribacillus saccharophilus TaxID=361277 RepID=UPI000BA72944|nr:hypothetical protein [Terribacillus saccharophilus]PAF18595.1 hypothetical protein CHH51_06760 [Terribacillus saccharophilus]